LDGVYAASKFVINLKAATAKVAAYFLNPFSWITTDPRCCCTPIKMLESSRPSTQRHLEVALPIYRLAFEVFLEIGNDAADF
jgi:hypothetical protein